MKKLLRKLFPPKKNELQIFGESIQKIMSQVETRYFDDLFVSAGKHSEKDTCIEIIIKNESNLFLREISLVSNHLIEYIAPGFTSHPMWDRCQMVHKGKTGIKEISPEIIIEKLDPGESVLIEREAIDEIAPESKNLNFKMAVLTSKTDELDRKNYHVRARVRA